MSDCNRSAGMSSMFILTEQKTKKKENENEKSARLYSNRKKSISTRSIKLASLVRKSIVDCWDDCPGTVLNREDALRRRVFQKRTYPGGVCPCLSSDRRPCIVPSTDEPFVLSRQRTKVNLFH